MTEILVATNNFWVGGRETYVATYLDYLRHSGFKASLIASSIFHDTPEAQIFESRSECGSKDYALLCQKWLEKGSAIVANDKPALIWAHHFDLLPAWLISQIHGIPLLTTFHGPLVAAGRPNDPMQALGMTLAIHVGEKVSAVSEEIAQQIKHLKGNSEPVAVIPNAIDMPAASSPAKRNGRPKRFVLITRPEKLGHVRKATLLFDSYRRRVGAATLTVAAGLSPEQRRANGTGGFNPLSKVRDAISGLGGTWCYEQGPGFLRSLLHVHFQGYTDDSRALIRKADVVLGMGRVVLEGLAEGKPCVVVGYEDIGGLVSPETFEKYRWSNFSGRGIDPGAAEDVCDSLLAFCSNGVRQEEEHLKSVSVANCGPTLLGLMQEIIAAYEPAKHEADLAKELSDRINDGSFKAEDIYGYVCARLNPQELSSLYLLTAG